MADGDAGDGSLTVGSSWMIEFVSECICGGASLDGCRVERYNDTARGVMRGRSAFQKAVLLCVVAASSICCGSSERNQSPVSTGGSPAEGGAAAAGAGSSGLGSGGAAAATGGSVAAGTGGSAGSGTGGRATGGQPSPNEWTSDFPLGEPGWKQSSEPFCDLNRGRLQGASVWADSRGVFSLLTEECVPVGRDLPSCSLESQLAAGVSLHFNDGTGWRVVVDDEVYSTFDLTGFEGGALLVGQPNCAAALLDVSSGTTRCTLPAAADPFFRRSFVVNESLAFLINQAGLHEYRAGAWSLLGGPLPEAINALWANEEVVYLAGEYQLYSWDLAGSELRALPNTPAARYTAVWGFASDDVWFGNSAGQLTHYDGQAFSRGSIPKGSEYPDITALWGSSGELFFSTYTQFGRVTGAGETETLLSAQIRGFWGTSPTEVFLAVGDSAFDDTACGAAFLLHFDGSVFHRF